MRMSDWIDGIIDRLHGTTFHSRRSRLRRSVELLEDRVVLSAVNASNTLAVPQWFEHVATNQAPGSVPLGGQSAGSASSAGPSYQREFLVRLTPEATAHAGSVSGAQALLANSNVSLTVVAGLGLPGQLLVTTTERDTVKVVNALQANPNVAHFEEDYSVGASGQVFPNEQTQSQLFQKQYGLHNTGQDGGVVDADIDAPEAWSTTTGSAQVVVSVIDSGVDFTHPDLYLNIWLNQAEIPALLRAQLTDTNADGSITFSDLNAAANASFVRDLNQTAYIDAGDLLDDPLWSDGVDSDSNGFEDDLVGWDFRGDDNRPFDEHRHGTHVAGILGATGNNGVGVVGVNWTTSIMPLRFLDQNNSGDVSDAIEAINYTTMMRTRGTSPVNIRVSNNSWGSSTVLSQNLFDAVDGNRAADILFVAAAGNGDVLGRGIDNDQQPFYPANLDLPNVISVGAFGPDGALARFSNFGDQSVDISAPGVGIVSTEPGGLYSSRNGTSMATPFVTGTAALILSTSSHANATAIEVRDAIMAGAEVSSSLSERIAGSRRLNAQGALTAPTFAPNPVLTSISPITTMGGTQVSLVVTYTDDEGIDLGSIDASDLEIARQGFSATRLTPTSVTIGGTPLSRTVTYVVPALGGTWDGTDNGTYTVTVGSQAVADTNGVRNGARKLGSFSVSIADASVFFVNTTLDTVDANLNDGVPADSQGRISLRAAVMQANRAQTPTSIVIPDGVYSLTRPGQNEDSAATGDLDLTSGSKITFMGGGQFETRIDAQRLDRVFDVRAGATAVLKGLSIQNGNAPRGGGITNSGTLTVDSVLVSSNTAETSGGGIYSDAPLTLLNSSLENNQSTSRFFGLGGGGLGIVGNATNPSNSLTAIHHSSIVNNVSADGGGGIFALDAAVVVTQSTISGNVAQRGSGGGLLLRTSTLTVPSVLANSTLADNDALSGSGGGLTVEAAAAPLTIYNSIIAANQASISADVEGLILSDGTNLIGQPSQSLSAWRTLLPSSTDFDQIGTRQHPLDPMLAPLRRVDGQLVHTLLAGSPALNNEVSGIRGTATVLNSTDNATLNPGAFAVGDDYLYSTTDLSKMFLGRTSHPGNDLGEIGSSDLNGDGFVDVVVADFGTISFSIDPEEDDDTVQVLFGIGDGLFQDPVSYSVTQAQTLTLADLTGDGRDDIVVTGRRSLKVLVNNGNGSFRAPLEYSVFDARDIVIGDMNADGKNDVVIAEGGGNSVSVLLGNGDGTLHFASRSQVGDLAVSVAIGDLNRDGRPDVVAATSFDDGLSVLLGNGNGTLQPAFNYVVGNAPNSVVLADVNGDLRSDAIVTSTSDSIVSVLIANADGTLQPRVNYSVETWVTLCVSDVNGDGRKDILVEDVFDGFNVLLGNSNGTFQSAIRTKIGLSGRMTVNDFDKDGRADVAIANEFDSTIRIISGNANGTFQQAPSDLRFSTGINSTPSSVAFSDFNRDGRDDLVVADPAGSTIKLLLGSTSQTLQSAVNYSVATGPTSLAVGDLDRDGFDDLVVASSTGLSVSVLLGNGNGTFDLAVNYSVGKSAVFVALGDLNGDGRLDVVTANSFTTDTISVLLGNGNGTLQAATAYDAGNNPVAVALKDLNGDGRDDVVVAIRDDSNVGVLRSNANGTLQAMQTYPVDRSPATIVLADLDQDGDAEIIVASEGDGTVNTMAGNGDGTFRSAVSYKVGRSSSALVIRDVDHDSHLDAVVANGSLSNSVSVLLGTGDGTLLQPFQYAVGTFPTSVALGDPNGDGIIDVATANRSEATVGVLVGQPTTTLFRRSEASTSQIASVRNAPYGFTQHGDDTYFFLGGIGGDAVELWASTPVTGFTRRIVSYLPQSSEDLPKSSTSVGPRFLFQSDSAVREYNATTGVLRTLTVSTGQFEFQAIVAPATTLRSPRDVQIGDLNGDGRGDLVVSSDFNSAGSINVLLSNSNGTLQPGQSISVTGTQPRLELVDLNLDGKLDAVIELSTQIGVLLGNGNGTFQAPVYYTVGSVPVGVTVSDLNRDGKLDVAVAHRNDSFVTVLLGMGNGTLQSGINYPAGPFAQGMVSADLNGDGNLDLAVAGAVTDQVHILLNNGNGTFSGPRSFRVGGTDDVTDIATNDLNRDGRADLVVVADDTHGVSVLLGNGDGSLQAAVTYPLGAFPIRLELTDLDGDSLADLAVADTIDGTVSYLRGNGDGTFQSAVTYAVGQKPSYLATGDINGDGRKDVVVTGFDRETIAVLYGQQTPQRPESVIAIGSRVFAASDGDILEYPANGSAAVRFSIPTVSGRYGTYRRSEYHVLQIGQFEGQLLALVQLTNRTGHPGEVELLLINPVAGSATSLLQQSTLRIHATADSLLVAKGQSIYLAGEVLGSGLGAELLVFDRQNGLRFLVDVLPGAESSQIQDLISDGDTLYFTALASHTAAGATDPELRRELFVFDFATNHVLPVRAGQQVTNTPIAIDQRVLFHSRRTTSGPDLLWSFDVNPTAVPDIGSIEVLNGSISGVTFFDANGNGRRDDGEAGRTGVIVFEDANANGVRESFEPFVVSRADDPATTDDEAGEFSFSSVASGLHSLREELAEGFVPTTPRTILPSAPALTALATTSSPVASPRLGLPSVVGGNVVYVNRTTGELILRTADGTETKLVTLQSSLSGQSSPIQSLGPSHGQDGRNIALTVTLSNGRELVLTADTNGRLEVVAQTGASILASPPGATPVNTTLADIEDLRNRGFDSISISGEAVGFLARTSSGSQRYYLGEDARFAEFQHAQVLLDGDSEVFVERVVEGTGAVLSGEDLFISKSVLDARLGANTGWRITTRSGGQILPLAFFDRIFDVSVAGQTAIFRATTSDGREGLYRSSISEGATLVVEAAPNPTGNAGFTVTRIGSIANNETSPSLAFDGENFVFLGGQIALLGVIDGELRTIVDSNTNFGGRTLADLSISHQALSGNQIAFLAKFTDGSESIYRAVLPAQAVTSVNVRAGIDTSDVVFGSTAKPGSIRGVSFTDANFNGTLDLGESINAGRTVYLDENLNGAVDPAERQSVTNSKGEFSFANLPAETTYVVREVLSDTLASTTQRTLTEATIRLNASAVVTVTVGSVLASALGESTNGQVSGMVFDDQDGDGIRDVGEAGRAGITVFVDENGDRILNGGERSAVTGVGGTYTLDLLRGNRQAVRVLIPAGVKQLNPLGNAFLKINVQTTDSPVEVTAGDLDRDGDDDLIASTDFADEVQIFINAGNGVFGAATRVSIPSGPGSLAIGKFRGSNQAPGIVVGHRVSNNVTVLTRQANGSFTTQSLVSPAHTAMGQPLAALGSAPYFVTTGDFDGDGDDDIAVASQNALPNGGAVVTFLSDGAGGFAREQILTLPLVSANSPTSITAARVDGDARVDLVVANLASNNVTILSNTGTAGVGRYSISSNLSVSGQVPTNVRIGDLNGDGRMDIATTNLGSNNISVLFARVNGSFDPAVLLNTGRGPADLELIDIDRNGSLDIVFTNSDATNRFGILRNRGAGLFQAAETSGLATLPDGTLAFSLAVGQFDDDNGDGVVSSLDVPDVAVSNRRDGSVGSASGGVTIGRNSIVSGALNVELTAAMRTATGLDFALRAFNQLPTLNAISNPAPIDEDAVQQFVALSGISDGGDPVAQTVRITAVSSAQSLFSQLSVGAPSSGNSTLTFKPALNKNGTATITVTVRDAGLDQTLDTADDGLSTRTFNVTVRPVNDLPVAMNDSSGASSGTTVIEVDVITNDDAANPDSQETLRVLAVLPPAAGGTVSILPDKRRVRFTPPVGATGQHVLHYVMSDGNETAEADLTISIGTVEVLVTAGNDNIAVQSVSGVVRILRNGVIDNAASGASSALVSKVSVTGGTGSNQIDLSGVTRAEFSLSSGVTVSADGGSGDDTLIGSEFNDSLSGGAGDDQLTGGVGADTLDGSTGTGDMLTETSNGTLTLTSTKFSIAIGTVTETNTLSNFERANISGSTSANKIDLGGFTVGITTTINGGGGNDTIIGSPGADMIFTLAGADSINGLGGADIISAGNGNDTISGGDGNDNLNGQNGNDVVSGDAGADVLVGGAGVDTLNGGSDNDFLSGQTEAGLLNGGDGNDVLQGNNANDTLNGDAGNDRLLGLQGDDAMAGGDGNDTLFGSFGNDTLIGGGGADDLRGEAGNDSLDGGAETDRIIEVLDTNVTITGNTVAATITTPGLGVDKVANMERINIIGGAAANFFDARTANIAVQLSGDAGNDTLLGGSKGDLVSGGSGDDVLSGGAGMDVIDGGEGANDYTFEKADTNFTVNGVTISSTITGTETLINVERIALIGGGGDNKLDASSATVPVVLVGGRGNDTLLGGSAADTLSGGNSNEATVVGGDGTDSLDGGLGPDVLENDPVDAKVIGAGDTTVADIFTLLPSWIDNL